MIESMYLPKPRRIGLLFALAFVASLCCVGCGQSPRQQAYVARSILNQAMADAITLHEQGIITAAQMKTVKAAKDEAIPLVDAMDEAASSGLNPYFYAARQRALRAIDELLERLAQYR